MSSKHMFEEQVIGSVIPYADDVRSRIFKIPGRTSGEITGVVLYNVGCDLRLLRLYFLSSLYDANRQPKVFTIGIHADSTCINNRKEVKHIVQVDNAALRRICSNFYRRENLKENGLPWTDHSDLSSVHSIQFNKGGKKFTAMVIFKKEIFVVRSGTFEMTRLPKHPFFSQQIHVSTKPLDVESILLNSAHKNSGNTCWITQTMNAFFACVGESLFDLFQCLKTLTAVEHDALLVHVHNQEENSHFFWSSILFSDIFEFLVFCNEICHPKWVDISSLRRRLLGNPLFFNADVSVLDQLDAVEYFNKLLSFFKQFCNMLEKCNIEKLRAFFEAKNPSRFLRHAQKISHRCHCGRCKDMETVTSEVFYCFDQETTQSLTDSPLDLSKVCNDTKQMLYCPNCDACNSTWKLGFRRCIIDEMELGGMAVVNIQLDRRPEAKRYENFEIPSGRFLIGFNCCEVVHAIVNHNGVNYGLGGHYTGITKSGDAFFSLDDHRAAVPLKSLKNASKDIALLLCRVVEHAPEAERGDVEKLLIAYQDMKYSENLVAYIKAKFIEISENSHKISTVSELITTSENKNDLKSNIKILGQISDLVNFGVTASDMYAEITKEANFYETFDGHRRYFKNQQENLAKIEDESIRHLSGIIQKIVDLLNSGKMTAIERSYEKWEANHTPENRAEFETCSAECTSSIDDATFLCNLTCLLKPKEPEIPPEFSKIQGTLLEYSMRVAELTAKIL